MEKEKDLTMPINLQFFASNPDDTDDDDISEGSDKDGSDNGADKGGKDKPKDNEGTTFTQEQVTRMMTKEKNQGRNAVYNELGIDPNDKEALDAVKKFIDEQKTESQKAAEKALEDSKALAEANKKTMLAEAKAEAMMLGAKKNFVEDIVLLAMSKMTDESDLKTIIGELKTKYPVWFGEDDSEDNKDDKDNKKKATGKKGTGSSVSGSDEDKNKNNTKSMGARLAAQRNGSSKKTSYWS